MSETTTDLPSREHSILFRDGLADLLQALRAEGFQLVGYRQDASLELARSVAMTQMVVFQFFHILNCRSFDRSIFRVPYTSNPFLAITLPLALLAHLGALHLPFMQDVFETTPLSLGHWVMVIAVGSLIVVAVEIDKAFFWPRRRQHPRRARESRGTGSGRGDSEIRSQAR